MPMGLTNAPERFMQMIKNLFLDMIDKRVVVCLDNIFIYSTTMKKHFKLIDKVLIY